MGRGDREKGISMYSVPGGLGCRVRGSGYVALRGLGWTARVGVGEGGPQCDMRKVLM